ncbi:hypothetical protein [Chenggangzhangella methanolivorans]|uniref:Hemolysin type calcium-binding protein n=1 Tax=Chenggangzhangella methanolivorans TaxID=1437009 RepID=A0A9E6RBP7_9HYPH|nr:hypothetical protein [Chenggangzhangella methanolivorans]QZO01287.1 hypothetical protein K6K41_07175 [Chenggangzhangella methanolivorans]
MSEYTSADDMMFFFAAEENEGAKDLSTERLGWLHDDAAPASGWTYDHLYVGDSGSSGTMGTEGRDLMYGKGGEDHLASISGADKLYGGGGGDVLSGGDGADTLVGLWRRLPVGRTWSRQVDRRSRATSSHFRRRSGRTRAGQAEAVATRSRTFIAAKTG